MTKNFYTSKKPLIFLQKVSEQHYNSTNHVTNDILVCSVAIVDAYHSSSGVKYLALDTELAVRGAVQETTWEKRGRGRRKEEGMGKDGKGNK